MSTSDMYHIDRLGRAQMVDIGGKPETERWAVARGQVVMSSETLAKVQAAEVKKGDVRTVAEVAGVMGAKRTAELIPLCHPLPLTHIEVRVEFSETIPGVEITASARTKAQTGVEMEAMTAVSITALTIYDMIKAIERSARITGIHLVEKGGGTRVDFHKES